MCRIGVGDETSILRLEHMYEDLRCACEQLFHLHILRAKPLDKGWMNLKWKVEAEEGLFVLKQFSRERYKNHNLESQQLALREHLRQYELGTPCPKLFTHHGDVIHFSPHGERFVLMEFMEGDNLQPGKLNEEQMYNLGRVVGRMHHAFNDGTHGTLHITAFVPPKREERLEHWRSVYENAAKKNAAGREDVIALIELQLQATEQFDIQLIASCEAGWAHRDLIVDNVLFVDNQVSAVLDFDRFAYDYPELDVARAIVSGALDKENLNIKAATAFLDGYRSQREFERGVLTRSFYMLWYMESVWWIHTNMDTTRAQPIRFAEEMTWLAKNLLQYSDMIGHL